MPTAEALKLAVDISGDGVVQQSRGSSSAKARVACGFQRSLCYSVLEQQQRLVLTARPVRGFQFASWAGACEIRRDICTVTASKLRSVTARFRLPANRALSSGLRVRKPQVGIRWNRSRGSGSMIIRGHIAQPGLLLIRLRRPGGGPLLSRTVRVRRGQFLQTLALRDDQLPRGAHVLPGGFIVTITGVGNAGRLPLQLRTVVLPSPDEGAVRRAYVSASDNAPRLSLPAGVTAAWAHFRFASQPRSHLSLTVRWYWPDGRLLGTLPKPNTPEVTSVLKSIVALPTGAWTAELRAGDTVIKRLHVQIG